MKTEQQGQAQGARSLAPWAHQTETVWNTEDAQTTIADELTE